MHAQYLTDFLRLKHPFLVLFRSVISLSYLEGVGMPREVLHSNFVRFTESNGIDIVLVTLPTVDNLGITFRVRFQ